MGYTLFSLVSLFACMREAFQVGCYFFLEIKDGASKSKPGLVSSLQQKDTTLELITTFHKHTIACTCLVYGVH